MRWLPRTVVAALVTTKERVALMERPEARTEERMTLLLCMAGVAGVQDETGR
jgi:hypothetical protein